MYPFQFIYKVSSLSLLHTIGVTDASRWRFMIFFDCVSFVTVGWDGVDGYIGKSDGLFGW